MIWSSLLVGPLLGAPHGTCLPRYRPSSLTSCASCACIGIGMCMYASRACTCSKACQGPVPPASHLTAGLPGYSLHLMLLSEYLQHDARIVPQDHHRHLWLLARITTSLPASLAWTLLALVPRFKSQLGALGPRSTDSPSTPCPFLTVLWAPRGHGSLVALHLVHSWTRSPSQPRKAKKVSFCLW
ncbi:hypothetical protein GGI35DRAFT_110602 [Trichoderma velutinum]